MRFIVINFDSEPVFWMQVKKFFLHTLAGKLFWLLVFRKLGFL